MSFHRLHKLSFLWLLLLSLLTSPASTFGYVWCVSADGHAVLEKAIAGDCSLDEPASAKSRDIAPVLATATDDCGACHDVSSTPSWGSARNRSTEEPECTPTPPVPLCLASQPLLEARPAFNHPLVSPSIRTPESLRHLRTIVLLI